MVIELPESLIVMVSGSGSGSSKWTVCCTLGVCSDNDLPGRRIIGRGCSLIVFLGLGLENDDRVNGLLLVIVLVVVVENSCR